MGFDQDECEEAAVAFGILSEDKPLPREVAVRGLSAKRVRSDVFARTLLDRDAMSVAATVVRKGAKA